MGWNGCSKISVWRGAGALGLTLAAAVVVPASAAEPPASAGGLWSRETLTGEWGGLRTRMREAGLVLGLTENSEVLGNVSGGQRQGYDYMGRTELSADLDLGRLVGWHGALIHANLYQIHGRGLGADNLDGNILDPSNIEANRTTRLFDAWLQLSVWNDRMSVRLGQLAADDEFLVSQYAAAFLNGTFGWPAMMSANLPGGGAAYPLATPGIRVRYAPTPSWSWQTAVFNGDPAGKPASGDSDPQMRDRLGLDFSTDGGAFVISELAYAPPADKVLPTAYKLGVWYHSGAFPDQRYDTDDGLQAVTGGAARQDRSDYGLYAVIDQMLLPKAGAPGQGLGGFLRLGGSPQDDRNPVSVYADGGLTYTGPFEGRDGDVAGIAFSYAGIGGGARDYDGDYNAAHPTATRPVRDYEAAIEATYQIAAAPWWRIQPDIQYIIHPGGSVASPTADSTQPASAMGDALILGVRTTVTF
jgi:porin